MRKSFQRGIVCLPVAALILCFAALPIQAQRRNQNRMAEAGREARDAARVFNQLMSAPDSAIPQELLERAEAVAVFPGVLQAAVIVGGRGGDGVVSRRTASGWSAPAFFNLGGGSVGPQIGASRTDYVLLFMNEGALQGLLQDRFEIGGEIGVVAGPYGRRPGASTNATADAAILSYARSSGAYIGAALRGVVITPDNDLNQAIYNRASNELIGENARTMIGRQIPASVRVFPQTLARYSTRR